MYRDLNASNILATDGDDVIFCDFAGSGVDGYRSLPRVLHEKVLADLCSLPVHCLPIPHHSQVSLATHDQHSSLEPPLHIQLLNIMAPWL